MLFGPGSARGLRSDLHGREAGLPKTIVGTSCDSVSVPAHLARALGAAGLGGSRRGSKRSGKKSFLPSCGFFSVWHLREDAIRIAEGTSIRMTCFFLHDFKPADTPPAE